MKTRYLLKTKGVFVLIDSGLSGHNRGEALLWRAVLDQSLLDATSLSHATPEDEQIRSDALRWFHAQPNTPVTINEVEDDVGKGYLREDLPVVTFTVDENKEFEDVCHLANLSTDFVRKTWMNVYRRCINDE